MTDKYVRQILRYLVGDGGPSVTANATGNLFQRLEAVLSGDGTESAKLDAIKVVADLISSKIGIPTGSSLAADLGNALANILGTPTSGTLADGIEALQTNLDVIEGDVSLGNIATSGTTSTIVNSTAPWVPNEHVGKMLKFSVMDQIADVPFTRTVLSNTADTITFAPRLPGSVATAVVGEILAGQVTIATVAESFAANDYVVEFVAGVGNNIPLSAAFANDVLTVTLATDGAGALDAGVNTATAIAAAIDLLPEFSATMTGAGGPMIATVVPIEFSGGVDTMVVAGATSFTIVKTPDYYFLNTIKTILGATNDFAVDKTVLGYFNSLYQHVHNKAIVFPTLAAGKVVTGGVAAWAEGAAVEIIGTATAPFATNAFDIHWINFEAASANDTYELSLYSGADASVEIGRVRTTKYSNTDGVVSVPIQIPAQAAGTKISAKVASAGGGEDTVTISVYAHLYS